MGAQNNYKKIKNFLNFKIRFLFIINIIVMLLVMCSCNFENRFQINTEESYYSNYVVENDKVYIFCTLSINNHLKYDTKVSISASFDEDKQNGLLKEALLTGLLVDDESKIINLKSGKNILRIVFIGDFDGNNQKANRLLPDIKIERT